MENRIVLDEFEGAGTLATHNGELGANWSINSDPAFTTRLALDGFGRLIPSSVLNCAVYPSVKAKAPSINVQFEIEFAGGFSNTSCQIDIGTIDNYLLPVPTGSNLYALVFYPQGSNNTWIFAINIINQGGGNEEIGRAIVQLTPGTQLISFIVKPGEQILNVNSITRLHLRDKRLISLSGIRFRPGKFFPSTPFYYKSFSVYFINDPIILRAVPLACNDPCMGVGSLFAKV